MVSQYLFLCFYFLLSVCIDPVSYLWTVVLCSCQRDVCTHFISLIPATPKCLVTFFYVPKCISFFFCMYKKVFKFFKTNTRFPPEKRCVFLFLNCKHALMLLNMHYFCLTWPIVLFMELCFYSFYKAKREFNWDFCSLEAWLRSYKDLWKMQPSCWMARKVDKGDCSLPGDGIVGISFLLFNSLLEANLSW